MARPGRPGPRLHRLPQRLDYTLIPAPLDLSLPLIAEKSPLPAIIVTPSSPSETHNYSIAFLAPPEKPSLFQRLVSHIPFAPAPAFPPSPTSAPSTPSKSKTRPFSSYHAAFSRLGFHLNLKFRTAFILSLILFVMICHLITHKLASGRPHLDFSAVGAIQHEHGSGSQVWLNNLGWDRVPDNRLERDIMAIDGLHVDGKGNSDSDLEAGRITSNEGTQGSHRVDDAQDDDAVGGSGVTGENQQQQEQGSGSSESAGAAS
ncbi:hypothetical protein VKT23_002487 [Stygiomarasmius scandens]|uniref:Uncharacterized protein n=1 Tax=Marasmiellus scandens TaxID=2682957 RepID=A0ABR1K258_9AGAR